MQMGHWKQLRVHLYFETVSLENWYKTWRSRADIPVSFALQVATRHFEEAVWAVVRDDFFVHTSWAADLVAVFAVQQVLERIEAVVGAGVAGIESVVIVVEGSLVRRVLDC